MNADPMHVESEADTIIPDRMTPDTERVNHRDYVRAMAQWHRANRTLTGHLKTALSWLCVSVGVNVVLVLVLMWIIGR
jgi:hypothetical protein